MSAEGFQSALELLEASIEGLLEYQERLVKQVKQVERMQEALTPSWATKTAYSGEFKMPYEFWDDDEEAYRSVELMIPWTQIKEIMAAISNRAGIKGDDYGN